MTLLTRTTSLVTNKTRKRKVLRFLRKNCIRIKGNAKEANKQDLKQVIYFQSIYKELVFRLDL
jgi:hypothetical protein